MDSTVTGAIIGATAAGGVAVVGFIANFATTRATIRGGVAAASDQRLWEKEAALYEELLASCIHRQVVRDHRLRSGTFDDATEARLAAAMSRPVDDWFALEGRVYAYASDVVTEAFDAYNRAERAVDEADGRHKAAAEVAKQNPNSVEAAKLAEYRPITEAARKAADEAIARLHVAVRSELHRQGKPRWWQWRLRMKASQQLKRSQRPAIG